MQVGPLAVEGCIDMCVLGRPMWSISASLMLRCFGGQVVGWQEEGPQVGSCDAVSLVVPRLKHDDYYM